MAALLGATGPSPVSPAQWSVKEAGQNAQSVEPFPSSVCGFPSWLPFGLRATSGFFEVYDAELAEGGRDA
jgi:hypothetical protein